MRPAWSWQFDEEHLQLPNPQELLDDISAEWAWAGSDGAWFAWRLSTAVSKAGPGYGGSVRGWAEPMRKAGHLPI